MGKSCPSRGTWIEICYCALLLLLITVVPLTGHVDRNLDMRKRGFKIRQVVPLTGHVDRNIAENLPTIIEAVVPLTGHVDRNCLRLFLFPYPPVVPLTGHVDRNTVRANAMGLDLRGRAPHGARG